MKTQTAQTPVRRRIVESGINWDWFTELAVFPRAHTVQVLAHYRRHRWDTVAPAPAATPSRIQMHEQPGRIVTAVSLDGVTYAVLNPDHIFAYPDRYVMSRDRAEEQIG